MILNDLFLTVPGQVPGYLAIHMLIVTNSSDDQRRWHI